MEARFPPALRLGMNKGIRCRFIEKTCLQSNGGPFSTLRKWRQTMETQGYVINGEEYKIRTYGPGKFNYMVDQYVYGVSLDGGPNEEAGSVQEAGWYGIMRGNLLREDEEAKELTEDERGLLRASVGAILSEDDQGFVHVTYYASVKRMERDWNAILVEMERLEGESES